MPLYDLDDVRAAARMQRIEYRSRRAMLDTANLGYELDDVCNCLLRLTLKDFHKSHEYESGPGDDAYLLKAPRPGSEGTEIDELYIKFRLLGEHVVVDLGSFHLQR